MKEYIRIVVDEDRRLVEQIDAIAQSEGLSRSDILRRAIRELIRSTPPIKSISQVDRAAEIAA